jgi:resuscitation-promoting factor RpfB
MIDQPNSGRNPGSTSPADDHASPTPSAPEGAVPRAQDLPPASGRNAARVPVAAILAWLIAGIVLLAVSVAALLVSERFGTPVTITVDGYTQSFRTTQPDVAGLLADQELALRPEDRVSPAPETPLAADLAVTIVRARPGLVDADGRLHQVYTQARTVGELIQSAGVRLGAYDEIWLDGAQVAFETALPAPVRPEDSPRFARSHAWSGKDALPVRLHIVRAVPIVVDDGTVPYTLYTTAPTIGEALLREQVSLYLGDYVTPSLGSRVSAGLHVAIERSKPVLVTADGRTTHTRTRGKTVGGTLMDLGILVTDNDRVTPPLDQPVVEQQQIRLVRISHVTLVERKPIPYVSVLVPDDNLEIDTQRLAQAGVNGEHRKRFKVITEDGIEVSRTLVDEWVAAQPVTRMVAFGRKIVPRTLDTPEGPVTYWRKIRMYSTSYSPARSGTPKSVPWYGRTRIGLKLRKGIVAVDPKVIPLQSWVYVPGYGKAIAGDTGGGIKSKWIDMGFEDFNYESWHGWTDVYLLDPPPTASRIMWVLPNYPPPGFPRR